MYFVKGNMCFYLNIYIGLGMFFSKKEAFSMKNYANEMYDYHTWANSKIFERLKEFPEDLYKKELKSSIFPSIQMVMIHIYLTDTLWLEVMSGKNMKEVWAANDQVRVQAEACTLVEMETKYNELSEIYKAFIKQNDMEKVFTVDNPYAGLLDTTPTETIFHISTHGNYHRGNVAAMLRQEGHASVMQDYGLYLYMQRNGFKSSV
jgi:uncharacterized damage-inducible protein DinB